MAPKNESSSTLATQIIPSPFADVLGTSIDPLLAGAGIRRITHPVEPNAVDSNLTNSLVRNPNISPVADATSGPVVRETQNDIAMRLFGNSFGNIASGDGHRSQSQLARINREFNAPANILANAFNSQSNTQQQPDTFEFTGLPQQDIPLNFSFRGEPVFKPSSEGDIINRIKSAGSFQDVKPSIFLNQLQQELQNSPNITNAQSNFLDQVAAQANSRTATNIGGLAASRLPSTQSALAKQLAPVLLDFQKERADEILRGASIEVPANVQSAEQKNRFITNQAAQVENSIAKVNDQILVNRQLTDAREKQRNDQRLARAKIELEQRQTALRAAAAVLQAASPTIISGTNTNSSSGGGFLNAALTAGEIGIASFGGPEGLAAVAAANGGVVNQ